jgi:nitrogen fixation protein NifU and related proteins
MAYSEKVVDHYENPRNVGSFDKGDESVGTGMVGAPACGDVMKLQIKVNPQTGVIEDARFKTYGCGSAIASSSLVTEWVKGKTLDEAACAQEQRDRRRTGLAPSQDPLLYSGRRRHQGGSRRLPQEARKLSLPLRRLGAARQRLNTHGMSRFPKPRRGTSPGIWPNGARVWAFAWASRPQDARAWPTSWSTPTRLRRKTWCSSRTASRCWSTPRAWPTSMAPSSTSCARA